MKLLITLALSSVLVTATPPDPQQIDVSAMHCQEFLESNDSRIDLIVTWFIGFYAQVHDPQVIDLNRLHEVRTQFLNFCKQQPDFRMTVTAEGLLGK